MNTRRLSYGLLLTLAAGLLVACGGDQPEAVAPATTATAEPAPVATAEPAPTASATAEAAPTPPPAKASKDRWVGKFAQDFSGDVADAAETAAKKAAGKVDKDNKKHDASIDKAKKAADWTIENTADTSIWSTKGKAAHTMGVKITKGDDPANLSLSFVKDGKKDLKTPVDVSVTFADDNSFTVKDPFAKKNPMNLVFKRQ